MQKKINLGFTKDQQTLIDLIECVEDAKGDFALYGDMMPFDTRQRLHKELDKAKRNLYNWVNKRL
jgi:hypothetical protein